MISSTSLLQCCACFVYHRQRASPIYGIWIELHLIVVCLLAAKCVLCCCTFVGNHCSSSNDALHLVGWSTISSPLRQSCELVHMRLNYLNEKNNKKRSKVENGCLCVSGMASRGKEVINSTFLEWNWLECQLVSALRFAYCFIQLNSQVYLVSYGEVSGRGIF